jgi:hypothetical protein
MTFNKNNKIHFFACVDPPVEPPVEELLPPVAPPVVPPTAAPPGATFYFLVEAIYVFINFFFICN